MRGLIDVRRWIIRLLDLVVDGSNEVELKVPLGSKVQVTKSPNEVELKVPLGSKVQVTKSPNGIVSELVSWLLAY